MKIIKQSCEILNISSKNPLEDIERYGRTCYQSFDKKSNSGKFVRMILDNGHHSVLEHISITIKFITDRGVSHELVRHRLCAFSQESTRYCNLGGQNMEFILPVWFEDHCNLKREISTEQFWVEMMEYSEYFYNILIQNKWSPQFARSVLPNSLKTEIVMTCNLRELRHIFNLRCHSAAHPQMVALMRDCLQQVHEKIPVVFDYLYEKFI